MKKERAFTPIVEYHISACKHRFSSTQFKLRSEYAYHPRSSPMSPQHLWTKSRSAANYLRLTITTARRTNIRSSLAKTRLTISFYIHLETPIPLDHARTRKNVVLHIDIYNRGTTNLSCITPTKPKRKTMNSWGAFRSMQQKQRFFNDVYCSWWSHDVYKEFLDMHDQSWLERN